MTHRLACWTKVDPKLTLGIFLRRLEIYDGRLDDYTLLGRMPWVLVSFDDRSSVLSWELAGGALPALTRLSVLEPVATTDNLRFNVTQQFNADFLMSSFIRLLLNTEAMLDGWMRVQANGTLMLELSFLREADARALLSWMDKDAGGNGSPAGDVTARKARVR